MGNSPGLGYSKLIVLTAQQDITIMSDVLEKESCMKSVLEGHLS